MSGVEALRDRLPPAAKDISLNLGAVLAPGPALTEDQRMGVALATAYAARNPDVVRAVLEEAATRTSDAVLDDARAAAAVMAMNNVFYRFRHVIGKDVYGAKPARLRMNRIGSPRTDKPTFELMCLAVSAINGCEACVRSHEAAVVGAGLGEDAVHEAVRIAAVLHAAAVSAEL